MKPRASIDDVEHPQLAETVRKAVGATSSALSSSVIATASSSQNVEGLDRAGLDWRFAFRFVAEGEAVDADCLAQRVRGR